MSHLSNKLLVIPTLLDFGMNTVKSQLQYNVVKFFYALQ